MAETQPFAGDDANQRDVVVGAGTDDPAMSLTSTISVKYQAKTPRCGSTSPSMRSRTWASGCSGGR